MIREPRRCSASPDHSTPPDSATLCWGIRHPQDSSHLDCGSAWRETPLRRRARRADSPRRTDPSAICGRCSARFSPIQNFRTRLRCSRRSSGWWAHSVPCSQTSTVGICTTWRPPCVVSGNCPSTRPTSVAGHPGRRGCPLRPPRSGGTRRCVSPRKHRTRQSSTPPRQIGSTLRHICSASGSSRIAPQGF